MILYNFRYRGPYEYDKFILNVFQFHNEMISLREELSKESEDNYKRIEEHVDRLSSSMENVEQQLNILIEGASER